MKMRPKSIKIIVISSLLIIVLTSYVVHIYSTYYKGPFLRRSCVECDPNELLPNIEKLFNINLFVDAKQIKTAKSIPIEGGIYFLVKFILDSNTVKDFLSTFPENSTLGTFQQNKNVRRWQPSTVIPKWYLEPIKQGEVWKLDSKYGTIYFNFDTTNKKTFVVYLNGYYMKRYAD